MRLSIRQFLELCVRCISLPEPVYEFGSYQVAGQEKISNLRPIFDGKAYVGADFREGPGVDVVLDLHHIDVPSGVVGTVLVLDTIEHVEFPRKAIDECYRILKSDGILVMSSVMNFPIHSHPQDYWRFTPEGFKSLLRGFEFSLVVYAGRSFFPHTVAGIGFKRKPSELTLSAFRGDLAGWKRKWSHPIQDILMLLYPYMPSSVLNFYRNVESRGIKS